MKTSHFEANLTKMFKKFSKLKEKTEPFIKKTQKLKQKTQGFGILV